MELVKERAMFADRINTLELEAQDDMYTPTQMNDDVLPEAASELSSGMFNVMQKFPFSRNVCLVRCKERSSVSAKTTHFYHEK